MLAALCCLYKDFVKAKFGKFEHKVGSKQDQEKWDLQGLQKTTDNTFQPAGNKTYS